jgi:DNA-binding transcriptional LysR family regulator
MVRIGATGDFTASGIALGLTSAQVRRPGLRFEVYTAGIDSLMRELREGDVDLAIWVSATGPALDTPYYWTEELVWMRAPSTRIEPGLPVRLVSYGEEGLFTRSAISVLSQAGRECELAFVGPSLLCLAAAVTAGFGVMALPRSRADIPGLSIWKDAPLPKLPNIFCGIYVRGGADVEEREQIAETIVAALRPDAPLALDTRIPASITA